jgi:hypothetical protein
MEDADPELMNVDEVDRTNACPMCRCEQFVREIPEFVDLEDPIDLDDEVNVDSQEDEDEEEEDPRSFLPPNILEFLELRHQEFISLETQFRPDSTYAPWRAPANNGRNPRRPSTLTTPVNQIQAHLTADEAHSALAVLHTVLEAKWLVQMSTLGNIRSHPACASFFLRIMVNVGEYYGHSPLSWNRCWNDWITEMRGYGNEMEAQQCFDFAEEVIVTAFCAMFLHREMVRKAERNGKEPSTVTEEAVVARFWELYIN